MDAMAPQITNLAIVYLNVYSGADQRKYQSSASLASVRGIHRWPVHSSLKWPVTRKMFPFDDVTMLPAFSKLSSSASEAILKRIWVHKSQASVMNFYRNQCKTNNMQRLWKMLYTTISYTLMVHIYICSWQLCSRTIVYICILVRNSPLQIVPVFTACLYPDSKVHGANMGPTWVLSAPDVLHVGLMNLAIRVVLFTGTRLFLSCNGFGRVLIYPYQSGKSPKVVAPFFLLLTLVAIL